MSVEIKGVDVAAVMAEVNRRIEEKRETLVSDAEVREIAERPLKPRAGRARVPQRPPGASCCDGRGALELRVRPRDHLSQQPRRRGRALETVRRLLRPVQKLFWNPNPMIAALSRQSDLNQTYAHLLHNLVEELTRLNLEVAGPEEPHPAAAGPRSSSRRAARRRWRSSCREPAGKPSGLSATRTSPTVHQLLAALSYGDAIGNEALAIQAHLRARGLRVGHLRGERAPADGAPGAAALAVRRRCRRPETVCLFHFSIGSAAGAPHLPRARPAGARSTTTSRPRTSSSASIRTWRASATTAAASWRRSRRAPSWRSATASSTAGSWRRPGFARTGRAADRARPGRSTTAAPSPVVRRLYARRPHATSCSSAASSPTRGSTTSSAPSRCYQRYVEPHSRLLLVGDHRGHERYYDRLQELVRELRVRRGGVHRPRGPRRAAGVLRSAPTCSCASPSTRASACRCWRRWPSACRWSPTTRAPCAETLRGGGVLLARQASRTWSAELCDRVLGRRRAARGRPRDAGSGRSQRAARDRLRRAAAGAPGARAVRAVPP